MKPPFSYEKRPDLYGPHKSEFRVADADDDRVATCWDEENAVVVVARLNAVDGLLAALHQVAELDGDCDQQKFKLTRFQAAQVARAAINKARGMP